MLTLKKKSCGNKSLIVFSDNIQENHNKRSYEAYKQSIANDVNETDSRLGKKKEV